jgi:hypothetical protein
MRTHSSRHTVPLASFILLAFIGTGCTQSSNDASKSKPGSGASDPQQAFRETPSRPTLEKGGKYPQTLNSSVTYPSASTSEWLLDPGLFDVDQGVWLGWIGLAFGLLGTGYSIHCSRKLSRLSHLLDDNQARLIQLDANISKAYATINQLRKIVNEASTRSTQLQASCKQLEERYTSILVTLNSQRLQQKPEPDPISFRLASTVENPPVPSQTYIQSSQQKLAEITAAVNRGDRQVVRSENQAQLNITNESENAISMGRLNETQLEEVTAGGSYWIASIGAETWLYPTEQTLKGYSQSQRPTGIYTYVRQPIPSAQVVSPARLALNGSLWSVAEPGSIAVPA